MKLINLDPKRFIFVTSHNFSIAIVQFSFHNSRVKTLEISTAIKEKWSYANVVRRLSQ